MEQQIFINTSVSGLNRFYGKVYGFVGMGLGLSAFVSYLLLFVFPQHIVNVLSQGSMMLLILLFVEIGLVMFASREAAKNSHLALPLFLIYSVLNGYTLSFILAFYAQSTVFQAFLSAAIMFVVMAALGLVIKRDLSGMGRALIAALWGVIVASLINMFLGSSGMSYVISLISVVIFSGLIAWDNQRIRLVYENAGGQVKQGWAISLALSLYLDFINLFLSLLRIFGRND